MLRTRSNSPQITLVDPFLPEELKALPAELAAIDRFLDDERFFASYRPHFDPLWGRPSTPIETYLRMMYLKFAHGLGYETLVKEVTDSLSWRRFCRIGLTERVPHPTTLVKITRRVGSEAVDQLNRALRDKARAQKLIRCRTLRADTTVVEADVGYPTDAGLLARAVGAVGRAVARIKEAGGAPATKFRDRKRSAGKKMRAITGNIKRRTGERKTQVERLTADVAAIARKTLRDARRVLANAQRKLRCDPRNGRLRRWVAHLKELLALTERALYQTGLRLAGQRSIPDRMVSLSDPDARPIMKGKLSHPVEFGYKLMLADGREGFIEAYQLYTGNPADHDLLATVIDRYRQETGRAPAAVAADRGFGLSSVEDELRAKGVGTVVIPRRGRPDGQRRQVEAGANFKRLVKWRTGAEGRISCYKRSFSGRRTRFKRACGAKTWVAFGVLSHNLAKVGAATVARQ